MVNAIWSWFGENRSWFITEGFHRWLNDFRSCIHFHIADDPSKLQGDEQPTARYSHIPVTRLVHQRCKCPLHKLIQCNVALLFSSRSVPLWKGDLASIWFSNFPCRCNGILSKKVRWEDLPVSFVFHCIMYRKTQTYQEWFVEERFAK